MMSTALVLALLAGAPQDDLLAEVGPTDASAAALSAVDPSAVRTERSARVQLWRVTDAGKALRTLEATHPGKFAPVFRDGGKTKVPAGGVLVWVKDRAVVDARKLTVLRDFGGGLLLVASMPGVETLALSDALAADARVQRAMPNWWLRAVKR